MSRTFIRSRIVRAIHMRSTDDDVYLGLFTYNEAAKSYSLASTYAHTYIFDEVTSTATTVPDGATVEKYMLTPSVPAA